MLTGLMSLLLAATPSLDAALEAYEFGELEKARTQLGALLDPIQLEDSSQVVTARQFLGATHYLLGDLDGAEAEFVRLLRLAPEHRLDPGVFSPELVRFFESVRVRAGLAAPSGEVHATEGERSSSPPPPPPSVAAANPIEPPESREPPLWPAFVPFGVGQFNNGRTAKGSLLLVGESLLFGTALTTFILFRQTCRADVSATCEVAPEDESKAATLQTVALTTLYVGIAAAVIGVIEAVVDHPGSE
jgi:hypothetical protein